MKVIVYSRPDGGVSIVNPTPNFLKQFQTVEQALVAIQAKDVPSDATNIEVMEQTLIPSREFRNAWQKPSRGPPVIDMPKAREIHCKRLAAALLVAPRSLETLETEARIAGRAFDADKAASDAVAIHAIRLSDLATQIAAASNATALMAVWPEVLPR